MLASRGGRGGACGGPSRTAVPITARHTRSG